ncbi:HERV-K_6q14.1 provirus ancestral Gag poly [Podarcis lilfordi]|uniref:HERV-K_6q14.1 provirus ancestral Gag poly n=1 Tax=Podarcis lilfordi TaxID=74358 RepID=A0AA35VW89_9SAUR|nr:HERV-K_6q14.1 provirus ancestral Gag poly [Podarcis lilfordi]
MQHLLRENKQQAPEGDLIQLILAIDEQCPWFPEDGTWEIPAWDKIGDHLHGHGRINVHVLSAWAKVHGCMATLTPKNIFLASSPPKQKTVPNMPSIYPAAPPLPPPFTPPRPPDSQPLPAPSAPSVTSQPPPPTPLGTAIKQAAPLLGFSSGTELFPVLVPAGPGGGPPRHEQFDYRLIKEVHDSVQKNGVQAPYTLGLLNTIFQQPCLPEDIKLLARTILPPSGVIVFMQEWQFLCQQEAPNVATALNNAAAAAAAAAPAPAAGAAPPPPPPVPTPQDVLHGLIGTGNFFTIAQQIAAGAEYWEVATRCAKIAFQKVPDTKGDSTSRWGTVRQGPSEPYAVFIDHLYDSLSAK